MAEFITIANINELLPGQCRVIQVSNRTLALFNVAGAYYATDNACLHNGGSLGDGILNGEMIICPLHDWQFNVITGESPLDKAVKVETFDVQVSGENVQVKI